MVAFAGHKYAARSNPILVSDSSNTITSFTLVNSKNILHENFSFFISHPLLD